MTVNTIPSTRVFRSGCLQLTLSPDSRGYVLFSLVKLNQDTLNTSFRIGPIETITCEYLIDLAFITNEAAKWIMANCDEILYESRHMYYRFREVPLVETPFVDAEPISTS